MLTGVLTVVLTVLGQCQLHDRLITVLGQCQSRVV